jgi:DNA-binding NtrC family response regulator
LLVVEDEPLIRMLLVEELVSGGYRVLEAENATDALHILYRDLSICLVVTDVIMPGPLTGLDLANWVAEHRPEVRVIVTSGYVSNREALLASRKYAHFVQKPYRTEDVLREVEQRVA